MNAPLRRVTVRGGRRDGRLARAAWLALLLPAALLAGAWGSQLIGGLYPCEMCHWQRWPHYAALPLALAAVLVPAVRRPMTVLAAIAIAVSGVIGVMHAGVEYHWWEGFTACTSPFGAGGNGDMLATILAAPVIRCDAPQWSLLGISLAGYNAILSLGGALVIGWLALKRGRA